MVVPESVAGGGFPAWRLPMDESGAAFARWVVKAVFGSLGLDRDLTYDMVVALSELATNVHVHACGGKAPEIWAYRTWGTRPEVVIKVYDTEPWHGPIPTHPRAPSVDSEGGRGLALVDGLVTEHGGRWGIHRTCSRLNAVPTPGKVVYVAIPLPRLPVPVRWSALQTADQVYGLLAARGLGRMQGSYGYGMAVICVRAGVHVWVREDSLSYTVPGQGTRRHVLGDSIEVTEQVVRHCAELDGAPGSKPP